MTAHYTHVNEITARDVARALPDVCGKGQGRHAEREPLPDPGLGSLSESLTPEECRGGEGGAFESECRVKDIKTELRELCPDLKKSGFEALWRDFSDLAGFFKPQKWTMPHPGYVQPPGWRRRFENLRSAMRG
jgi:hypothetical protein